MKELVYGIDNIVLLLFCFSVLLILILLYVTITLCYERMYPPPAHPMPQAPPRIGSDLYLHSQHRNRCAICMEPIKFEVEAPCGHVFCAQCIVLLWGSKHHRQLRCPYCRREVPILFEYGLPSAWNSDIHFA